MGEKTEAPTPRRRDEARAKGQGVGRSHEFSMGLTLGVGTLALASLLPGVAAALTGQMERSLNNLNPRAWRLDLENGLLIRDPHQLLEPQNKRERELILTHARRLTHYKELEAMDDYPLPAQRLLKRLTRPRIDRLINQVM